MTATMTRTQIQDRIAILEATDRALVGSDEGTHSHPRTYRLYETITGERYAVASFGGSNGTRCTEEEACVATKGCLRIFPEATAEIRQLAQELAELRKALRAAR